MSHLYYTHSFNSESLCSQFETGSLSERRLRKDIARDKNWCFVCSSKREENCCDSQPGKDWNFQLNFRNIWHKTSVWVITGTEYLIISNSVTCGYIQYIHIQYAAAYNFYSDHIIFLSIFMHYKIRCLNLVIDTVLH